MAGKKPKEYQLKTLAEVLEVVTEENIGGFMTDFARWLAIDIQMRAPELKGKIEIKNRDVFHWIDDGKTEIKATIEIVAASEDEKCYCGGPIKKFNVVHTFDCHLNRQ